MDAEPPAPAAANLYRYALFFVGSAIVFVAAFFIGRPQLQIVAGIATLAFGLATWYFGRKRFLAGRPTIAP